MLTDVRSATRTSRSSQIERLELSDGFARGRTAPRSGLGSKGDDPRVSPFESTGNSIKTELRIGEVNHRDLSVNASPYLALLKYLDICTHSRSGVQFSTSCSSYNPCSTDEQGERIGIARERRSLVMTRCLRCLEPLNPETVHGSSSTHLIRSSSVFQVWSRPASASISKIAVCIPL